MWLDVEKGFQMCEKEGCREFRFNILHTQMDYIILILILIIVYINILGQRKVQVRQYLFKRNRTKTEFNNYVYSILKLHLLS